MKKRHILTLLLTLPLLLTSCDSFGHVHNWTSFYDNGDGTHSRMCLKDSSHIETNNHEFKESVIKEATDKSPGEVLKKCSGCGHEETVYTPPTESHVYDQEVAQDKYLYKKCSEYSSIYYKSSSDGSYGDPNYLFEKTFLPEGYSNIEYIQGNGTEFIDTGIEKTDDTFISYNKCKCKNGRLPSNYQEVEYIEFTGKQFFKTSIYQAATWDFDLQWSNVTTRQLMGYSGSDSQYFGVNEGKYAIYYASDTKIGNRDEVMFSTENYNRGLYVNSFKILDCGMTYESPDTTFTIGKLGSTFYCEFKLYSLTCYKNKNVIGEFVPCYNIETNEIGLYDLHKNEFLNNLGSAPLLKGDDVVRKDKLPSDYQELQYIESTGNQIIDTGYGDNLDITINAKFEVLTADTNYFYGSKQNDKYFLNNGLYSKGGERPVILEYGWQEVEEISAELGIVELEQTISDNEFIVSINRQSTKLPLSTTKPSENLKIFGCINTKGEDRPYGSGLRCYSFLIKDNNVTVREYVPAKRKSDDKIGMYDLAENSFYFDEGFLPGPEVNEENLIKSKHHLNDKNNENIKIGFNYVENESFYYYGRIYDAVITSKGNAIQKLIPALRNSDSKIGMYDLIGGKFYEQNGNFKNSGVVGHILDNGVVVKEPTHEEDGKICYTCSICGTKIYKVIPRLAYKVNFTYDEGIKELRIHSDNDPNNYEIKDFAYTRNPGSFNFSTSNASVWFEIIFNDGYEFNELTGPTGMYAYFSSEDMHVLAFIQGDIDINITSKYKSNS